GGLDAVPAGRRGGRARSQPGRRNSSQRRRRPHRGEERGGCARAPARAPMRSLKRMLLLMLGAAAIVVLIYGSLMATMGKKEALAAVFGPVVRRPVDFPSLELRPTPNQFLVCPPGYCKRATPHMEAPVYALPVEELRDAWLHQASSHPGVTLLGSD